MSKFFKVFGIGAALGTIAYGIFKYKNDQKFKEKVEEVRKEAVTKACIFTIEHPKAALGIIAGTVVGGSVLGGMVLGHGIRSLKKPKFDEGRVLVGKELLDVEKKWDDTGHKEHFDAFFDFINKIGLNENEALYAARYINNDGEPEIGILQEMVMDDQGYTYKKSVLI